MIQLVQFAAIATEHRIGMAGKRVAQGLGCHKRITVAVAANPAADFQNIRHFHIRIGRLKITFHAAVEFRQRFKKAHRENVDTVVDFVVDAQFVLARFGGLPQTQQDGFDVAAQVGQRFGIGATLTLRQ